ncbi:MAG: hypothetical protein ACKV22_40175 [Bryobacteraceae bacterium]
MTVAAKSYIFGVVAAGTTVLALALANWSSPDLIRCLTYLLFSVAASLVKLNLPGMRGTYSLSFLLLLFGIAHFTLAETLIAGCSGALVQTVWKRKTRPTTIQVLFNVSNAATSLGVCYLLARMVLSSGLDQYRGAVLALVACVYFVINTMLVSGVLSLLEGKPFAEACEQWYLWSFPYYLAGAALVGLIPPPGGSLHPEAWLILLPLVYLLHFFLGLEELHSSSTASGAGSVGTQSAGTGFYLLAVLAAGFVLLLAAAVQWQSQDPWRFACYLALALAASTLKVRLPGMTGTMSVNFVLLLVAIAELSLAEVVVMSALAAVVQTVWRTRRQPTVLQVLFNLSCLSLSSAAAWLLCRHAVPWMSDSLVGGVILATLVLYASNTILFSAILSLRERGSLAGIWQHCYFWTCPYYLVGAMAAGLMIATNRTAGWPPSLMVLPAMALVYVSYRAHVTQAVDQHQQ